MWGSAQNDRIDDSNYYHKINGPWFLFPIVNFPFTCSNIPAAPDYGVYIFKFIQYSSDFGSYNDILDSRLMLTRKLLNHYTVAIMTWLIVAAYPCRKHFAVLSLYMTYHYPSIYGFWLRFWYLQTLLETKEVYYIWIFSFIFHHIIIYISHKTQYRYWFDVSR